MMRSSLTIFCLLLILTAFCKRLQKEEIPLPEDLQKEKTAPATLRKIHARCWKPYYPAWRNPACIFQSRIISLKFTHFINGIRHYTEKEFIERGENSIFIANPSANCVIKLRVGRIFKPCKLLTEGDTVSFAIHSTPPDMKGWEAKEGILWLHKINCGDNNVSFILQPGADLGSPGLLYIDPLIPLATATTLDPDVVYSIYSCVVAENKISGTGRIYNKSDEGFEMNPDDTFPVWLKRRDGITIEASCKREFSRNCDPKSQKRHWDEIQPNSWRNFHFEGCVPFDIIKSGYITFNVGGDWVNIRNYKDTTDSFQGNRGARIDSLGDAEIFIFSIPPVANVYMNGVYIGRTNSGDLKLKAGRQRMSFGRNGQPQFDTIMTFKKGVNPSVKIRLPYLRQSSQ
jgi:hypothetical protein